MLSIKEIKSLYIAYNIQFTKGHVRTKQRSFSNRCICFGPWAKALLDLVCTHGHMQLGACNVYQC